MSIEMIEEEAFNQGTQIKVIGVGGGGGNAVEHMITTSVGGVEFICANTDAQALSRSSAHKTIQLGGTGLGAGSKPDKGREAAVQAEADIRQAIEGAHMLFITAGMGGGTGTGAAPVIAKVAKEMGILTVGVVTKPFDFEGGRRMSNADSGLAELEANVDSLIVVLNEKLLEGVDLSGAKGVLVLISACKGSLKLKESKMAMETIRACASPDAHVIYGTANDEKLGDEIRVTVIATGLSRQGGARRTAPPLQVLRTGTDNVPFHVPTLNTIASPAGTTASMGNAGAAVAQPDYGSMATPSVWRTNRTQAAAKVDALSSGGMDDYEIPAFLRKQAD